MADKTNKKPAKQPAQKPAANKAKPASSKAKTDEAGYFKGSWQELQQVRWPDRKATWTLTLAVILFSLFFAGVILGLDYLFETLFRKVIL